MTDFEKRLDEAAETIVYKEICFGGLEYSSGSNTYKECVKSFKHGARWGYAQAEAEIKRLREALEWYAHDMEVRKIEGKHYICPQKDSDSDGALFYAIGKRARDALKVG